MWGENFQKFNLLYKAFKIADKKDSKRGIESMQ